MTKSEFASPTPATVQTNWRTGNWSAVLELDPETVSDARERGRCHLLHASAHLQLGHADQARIHLSHALDCGCEVETAARVLIAGLHNTLARIELLREDSQAAYQHFREVEHLVGSSAPTAQSLQAKAIRELISLELLPSAVELIESGLKEITSVTRTPSQERARATILASEIDLLNWQITLMQKRGQLYHAGTHSTHAVESEMSPMDLSKLSVAQLGQDLWVLEKTEYKRGGFFVDFGATDGVRLNNTFLLEKQFDWTGICAEPNPKFFEQLCRNRKCIVGNDCISDETGRKVQFVLADEFGGIVDYGDSDHHAHRRAAYLEEGHTLELETISLNDVLDKYGAPRQIDYLSIDTEGNELEILASLDFDKWDIKLITVEHNHTAKRDAIFELLSSHGYERTEADWDDWYAK